ncbi:MAG TPA: cold shock domain-containing protein [Steroidobacteraceae bacterium]|nr:cold shock domain-containing protein [Steroidobacteraceae bacterium]
MRPSPVIQATQEAIGSLHAAAARWGQVFDLETPRAQIEGDAERVGLVFEAFQLAYASLPRFRTEPALRRFSESMQKLTRALQALRLAGAASVLDAARTAAAAGAEQAEAALAALTGKAPETPEAPRIVHGAVQRLLADRGYGFVRAAGSTTDLFFNSQAVQAAQFASLRVGQPVSFRVVPDPRVSGRMQAIEVQLLRT